MRVSPPSFKCLLLAVVLLAGNTAAQAAFKKPAVEATTSLPASTIVERVPFLEAASVGVGTQLSVKQRHRMVRKMVWGALKSKFRRPPVGNSKSQLTAALLCFFLGALGIHRFYLGYTLEGVLQLLGFLFIPIVALIAVLAAPVGATSITVTFGIIPTLLILAYLVWILVDFVRILIGTLQPKNGSYSKRL